MTAQFDDTESGYSNEASAAPMGSVSITLSEVGGPFDQGDTFEVVVSMDNPYAVAGIELHLEDTPEAVTVVDVQAVGAIENIGTVALLSCLISSHVQGLTLINSLIDLNCSNNQLTNLDGFISPYSGESRSGTPTKM